MWSHSYYLQFHDHTVTRCNDWQVHSLVLKVMQFRRGLAKSFRINKEITQ